MNRINLEEAIGLIRHDLASNWHLDDPSSVDIWEFRAERPPPGTGKSRGSATLRLMADDGNFVVALLVCDRRENESDEVFVRETARSIRIQGSQIRRATLDAGIHRLVALMILSADQVTRDHLMREIPKITEGMGQFRVIMLPAVNAFESADDFAVALRLRRAAIGPLPSDRFLHETDEAELVRLVGSMLEQVPLRFREPVRKDIEMFLQTGAWSEDGPWLNTSESLEHCRNSIEATEMTKGSI